MRWLTRLVPLVFLVAIVAGLGFAASQVSGDHGVIETVTTNADGQTVITREGSRNFGGFAFFPFAFFGVILFWFLILGLLKAVFFGFRGGRGHGHGGWRGPHGGDGWRQGRERWEARAREIHEEWHAAEGRGEAGSPAPGVDPGGAA